ncbi:interleukin 12Ba precursor [Aulostomus maculatus]
MSSGHIKAAERRHCFIMDKTDDKMRFLTISIIFAFEQFTCQNPLNHWTLQPNVLVVQVSGDVGQHPLSCLDSPDEEESDDIVWKVNGEEEDQRGNSYQVQLVESFGGGIYTCHSRNGSLLNHTVVLIQEDDFKRKKILVKTDTEEDYLKCSARNYNGEFRCSWTWHPFRVGKVALVRVQRLSSELDLQCSADANGQCWTCSSVQSKFSCSVDSSGQGISCLDEQYCLYAEESQHIHITVYVRTLHFLIENYSKHFHLSEIVKPDKVRISKLNTTMIKWTYPSSWSSPYSYFPLTFQITQLRRPCEKCENPCAESKASQTLMVHSCDVCQFKVKRKAVLVCVRAKDAICDSQWSEWSHLRLGRNKNRKKKKQ